MLETVIWPPTPVRPCWPGLLLLLFGLWTMDSEHFTTAAGVARPNHDAAAGAQRGWMPRRVGCATGRDRVQDEGRSAATFRAGMVIAATPSATPIGARR